MHQELGDCKEQGECHEGRNQDDHDDPERRVGPQRHLEFPKPIEETDPLGLDRHDGAEEHDVIAKQSPVADIICYQEIGRDEKEEYLEPGHHSRLARRKHKFFRATGSPASSPGRGSPPSSSSGGRRAAGSRAHACSFGETRWLPDRTGSRSRSSRTAARVPGSPGPG